MKQRYIMSHELARQRAIDAVRNAPAGYVIEIREPTRTLMQNDLMWSLLDCLEKQIVWYGHKLTAEEWKDFVTALMKKQKVVPGYEGGIVVLASRTSKMSKKDMSELIETIYWFGSQHNVNFQDAA